MGRGLMAMGALALASCSAVEDPTVPGQADIARLEAALEQHPCVGDLDQWERNYRFSRKTGLLTPYSLNPDLDVIEFHLRRAGTIRIVPGRNILRADENPDWPDSSVVRTVDGRFKIEGGMLDVARCPPVRE